jgi:hypothetical protein
MEDKFECFVLELQLLNTAFPNLYLLAKVLVEYLLLRNLEHPIRGGQVERLVVLSSPLVSSICGVSGSVRHECCLPGWEVGLGEPPRYRVIDLEIQ